MFSFWRQVFLSGGQLITSASIHWLLSKLIQRSLIGDTLIFSVCRIHAVCFVLWQVSVQGRYEDLILFFVWAVHIYNKCIFHVKFPFSCVLCSFFVLRIMHNLFSCTVSFLVFFFFFFNFFSLLLTWNPLTSRNVWLSPLYKCLT